MRRLTSTHVVVLVIAWLAMACFAEPAAGQDACSPAADAREEGDLLNAERLLLALTDTDDGCADRELKLVERRRKAAQRLVAIGDTLAATQADAAIAAYESAKRLDSASDVDDKLSRLEAAPPGGACGRAATLLRDGFVSQSRAEYLVLRESGEPCAKTGLEAVARRHAAVTSLIEIANGLHGLGDTAAATTVLDAAESLDKESAAVEEAQDSLAGDAVYGGAEEQGDEWLEQLRQLGVWLGAALAWLAAVLIALLLVAWLARGLQSFAHRARDGARQFPPTRPAIAAATVVGLVVAAVLWWVVGLELVAVAGGAVGLLLAAIVVSIDEGLLFRLLVRIEDFKTQGDKADAAGMSSQLAAAARGHVHGQDGPDMAGVTDAADPFDDITTALSAAGLGNVAGTLLKLARTLLPSRTVTLTGHVHAMSGAPCGLSLTLVEGRGHMVGNVTIWEDDVGAVTSEPNESALRRLAIAGAAWMRHELRREYEQPRDGRSASTSSWESDALFEIAAALRGASADARQRLYTSALEHDAGNLSALFDSAVLLLRSGDTDEAATRVWFVRTATTLEDPCKRDTLWFKATYQSAVVELLTAPRGRRAYDNALTRAYELVRFLLIDLLPQTNTTPTSDDATRISSLRRLEGPALALMASILLTAQGTAGGQPAPWARPNWRARLRSSLEDMPQPRTRTKLRAADLIACATSPDVVLGDRLRYNLACYYSRYAEIPGRRRTAEPEALRQLGLALAARDEDLLHWAAHDPGLAWIRDARPDAVREIIKPGDRLELAGIHAIGSALATELEKDHGIDTSRKLATQGPRERAILAERLDVGIELVDRWVGLAALTALPQLTIDHVNLLDEARIRSLADLGIVRRDEIQRRLRLVALRRDVPQKVPDVTLTDTWVAEAARRAGLQAAA